MGIMIKEKIAFVIFLVSRKVCSFFLLEIKKKKKKKIVN